MGKTKITEVDLSLYYFLKAEMLALVVVLIATVPVYIKYRFSHDGKRRSFLLYVLGVFISGYLVATLFLYPAIHFGCSGNSGAGCAFGLAMLVEPLAIAVGILGYLFYWVKSRNASKTNSQ